MGWLSLVGSIKILVSFAKEPYKRDNILQKRPIILSYLLIVATPYHHSLPTCEPLVHPEGCSKGACLQAGDLGGGCCSW